MKKLSILAGALLALVATLAFADVEIIPSKAVPSSFRGSVIDSLNQVDGEGTLLQRIARFTYDTAVDGTAIGAYTLDAKLPANSIVSRTWLYIDTQFTDSGTGTVAIHCEDANNLFTATDITGNSSGTLLSGAIDDGTAGQFVKSIAADCNITATVAGAAQTAGKLTGWVEYVVHD